jgi:hypothetical protein
MAACEAIGGVPKDNPLQSHEDGGDRRKVAAPLPTIARSSTLPGITVAHQTLLRRSDHPGKFETGAPSGVNFFNFPPFSAHNPFDTADRRLLRLLRRGDDCTQWNKEGTKAVM